MRNSTELLIEYVRLDDLSATKANPRTHPKRQILQVAESFRRFGFNEPLLIDSQNIVRVGNARLEAARLCKMTTVPVIRLEHMTDADFRAYAITANRLAEKSEWDKQILAATFQEIQLLAPDLELTITGFEVGEIDLIIQEQTVTTEEAEETAEPDPTLPRMSRLGDAWRLGRHRLLCGNALDARTYQTLLRGDTADAVFTDPPFNVPIAGHVSGKGKVQHREFPMASGEMEPAEFAEFLRTICQMLSEHSQAGSLHYMCMDWRHIAVLVAAGEEVFELKNICVWVKDNAGMGSLYRSQHELVALFKKPGGAHRNNVQLGRFGRNRTNVWNYPGANSFSRGGEEGNLLALHPTVKPVQLVADALLDCTARGEIVLDCFLGVGTTLLAAERTGRRCYGIELDPLYVDTAIRRWEKHTGDKAVLETSAIPLLELKAPNVG